MSITLYNEDCLKILKDFPKQSINLILSDLPYGMTKMEWDKKISFPTLWKEYERILAPNGNIVLFSSGLFTIDLINSNRKLFKYKLIWKKNVPTGMSNAKTRPMKYYEEICVFNKGHATYNPIMKPREGKGKDCYKYEHYFGNSHHLDLKKQPKKYDPDWVQPSDVLEFKTVPNRSGKLHPTQKPVDLLKWLVHTYSNEEELVLDNCMGSGSTGEACIELNRNFIGIEIDPKYFEIAKNRLQIEETNE